MARGPQQPITEELHNDITTFFRRFYAMSQDGVICEDEQEETLDTLDRINSKAGYVADSFAIGFSTMRRGHESKMAVELTGRVRTKSRAA